MNNDNNDENEKQGFFQKIPALISSKFSIVIFLLLFVYLVIFGILGQIPSLKFLEPSSISQLILGNYTNVLSALGAAIAAGTGVSIHKKVKQHKAAQDEMKETLARLESKLAELNEKIKK
jgi:hypothetical protein